MKKIIILFLTLFCFISTVQATINDSVLYYSFDDTDISGGDPLDLSGNGFDGTNNGAITGELGILKQAFNYTTSGTDYVTKSYESELNPGVFTISQWIKIDTIGQQQFVSSVYGGASAMQSWYLDVDSSNNARLIVRIGGTSQDLAIGSTALSADTWYHLVGWYDGNDIKVYLNGVQDATNSFSGTALSVPGTPFNVGNYNDGSGNSFDGTIDEVAYYDRALTLSEIQQLYNSGMGENPYGANIILTINSPEDFTFYNTTLVPLNVTASGNTNLSYKLNGGTAVSMCSDCNSSTNLFLNSSIGLNNVVVISNLSGTVVTKNATYLVDIEPPQLSVNFPSEINMFNIDFTQYITFNQSDNVTCTVFVQETSNNASCLNQNYIFQDSGNLTLNVLAEDQAGNINVSLGNVLLVNPTNYFQVELSNGSSITDYTFGGRSDVNGTVTYTTYGDGLVIGENSLEFEKVGFQTVDFTFEINATPPETNKTFVATPAQLNINIFDRESGDLIDQLVNLQLTGASGLEVNTTNGTLSLDGTLLMQGEYVMLAISDGYFPDQRIFTFTNQEVLTINMYLLNETSGNAGQIIVIVENEKQELTPNIQVTMLEQDPSTNSFFEVTDDTTNINGQSFFAIELGNKKYIWRAFDPETGVSGQTSANGERVFVDADQRTIVLTFATLQKSNLIDGFFYDVVENQTARENNVSNILVTWDDTNNIVSEVCVDYYKDSALNRILLTSYCEASSSGFLETNVFVNTSFNTIAEVTVNPQGVLLDSFRYTSSDSFEQVFDSLGITDFFILFLFVFAAGLGIIIGMPWVSGIATMCVSWFVVLLFPSFMSSGIATIITIISIGILYGEVKKE